MIAIPDREHLLKNALERLAPNYDYIFIDCPPSLELLTVNALCAAGSLLVPSSASTTPWRASATCWPPSAW